ncbi:MAG: hypothetical protein H7Z13_17370, partial [Ferruginibacter sp.]|nr:hypothetical protein [Ferruginibacter sp.]
MKMILLSILVFLVSVVAAADIKIYSTHKAGSTENLAVTQLKEYLSRIYVNDQFSITKTDSARCNIYVSLTGPQKQLNGYQIKSDGKKIRIAAADKTLLLCAVYDFLEQQGCYFQLSEEFVPVYTKKFVLPVLSIQNKALAKKRIIFNWFNFLSGCSSWDLEDWKLYIRQAVKLKYNNLMVHAYGNNPMIEFSFNGQTKPIGFLASTDKGRDWGTQHVSDVRTMPGAADVFKSSVFSSEAANVRAENRHIAMKAFMNKVFDYAHLWGMKVMLAYDMDSKSVNPQNIIRTLADSSCIFVGGGTYALANPDSPEGYAYYKTQLRKILEDYPQVDEYVLWGRGEASLYWSLWGSIKMEELPRSWQREYKQYVAATPGFADSSYNYSIFAWAKMANTYQRILKDLRRDTNTTLSVGSWKFDFIPILNRFANKDITFIALDFNIEFDRKPIQQLIFNNSQQRRIIPVFWAQHDDFAYIGRPYQPFQKLASRFKS